jgi:hypothetical protein
LAEARLRDEFASKDPVTAKSLADLTGLPLTDVVPELNRMRSEGRVLRVSIGESGLVGWRLP